MKLQLILLILVISALNVQSFSFKSITNKLLSSSNSIFHWRTPVADSEEGDCVVQKFPSVDKIDPTKLSGEWFEYGRTITKLPLFSSSKWKFISENNPDQDSFFFAARLQNDKCYGPIKGSAISSNTNPGSFVLNYDGLKSKVEEEFKLIYADYDHVLVFYGCRRLTDTGTCQKDASFVALLSKQPKLAQSVLDPVYDVMKSICIDPHSLIFQDTSKTCAIDDQGEENNGGSDDKQLTCQNPAACTIGCPKCCTEDKEGCISCECNKAPEDPSSSSICKNDVSECEGTRCHLSEKTPGCKICECLPLLAAAPKMENAKSYAVGSSGDCPQSCRTNLVEDQLYCNCTNERICRTDKPHKNCQGTNEHYAFDYQTGTCPAYLGKCEDAINSFSSVEECLTTCLDVCDLHPVSGKCNNQETKYYYNRIQGKCTTFYYSGCEGNENNFPNLQACQQRCPSRDTVIDTKKLPPLCLLPEAKGTSCKDIALRYFFVAEANTCVPFHYGGCEGNENNFMTKEDCNKKCKVNPPSGLASSQVCQPLDSCDDKCKLIKNDKGCNECDCSAGNSLSVSVIGIFSFIIFMWLAY